MTATATKAIGWLLVHALNHLGSAADHGDHCCPRCCGACDGLAYYHANPAAGADGHVRATMEHDSDLSYWQHPDGSINWPDLVGVWAGPCENSSHEETTE